MAYDPVLVDRIRDLVLGTPGLEEQAMFAEPAAKRTMTKARSA